MKKGKIITLKEAVLVPELTTNLFSLTQAMQSGAQVISEGKKALVVKMDGQEMRFDCMIKNKSGHLLAAVVKPLGTRKDGWGDEKRVHMNEAHKLSGHKCERTSKFTLEGQGCKVIGTMDPCEACARAKIAQTPVGKLAEEDDMQKGQMIGMDSSGVRTKSLGGREFQNLKLDHGTDMNWSTFMKKKSEVVEDGLNMVNHIKNEVGNIKITFRMDNAGENKKF